MAYKHLIGMVTAAVVATALGAAAAANWRELIRGPLRLSDGWGWTCMAGWGWSDPAWGPQLGEVGPPGLALDVYNVGGINMPPAFAAGQVYAIPARIASDSSQEPAMALRVRMPRRWRFHASTAMTFKLSAINVNCEHHDNPEPVLAGVPAPAPWAAAFEADLRAGWYYIELFPVDPPTTRIMAAPI